MNQHPIGVFAANGRMGRAVIEAVTDDQQLVLAAALVREQSPLLGIDAGIMAGHGEIGISLTTLTQNTKTAAEVYIDFSLPLALEQHLCWCVEHNKKMVIGTTGLNAEQLALIDDAAKYIAIVYAPNMSIGVNVMINLLRTCAATMGEQCDIEIIEAHHKYKQDAPSGTALKFGEVIAHTLERDLGKCAVYGRKGVKSQRSHETIGFSTIRAADIVGEHTVMFADIGERLEITHKATSRLTFAKGALRAAKWLKNQPLGLYDMQTVLGLS